MSPAVKQRSEPLLKKKKEKKERLIQKLQSLYKKLGLEILFTELRAGAGLFVSKFSDILRFF